MSPAAAQMQITKTPSRQASAPLVDVIGPLTDEQAAQVVAVFNRHMYTPENNYDAGTPDAA